MKKVTSFTLTAILIFLFASCDDDNKGVLDNSLTLNKSSITLSYERALEAIELKSNEKWVAEDVPYWITLSPTSGERSETIEVDINENRSIYKREVDIKFINKSSIKYLKVEQEGINEDAVMPWLGVLGVNKMTYDATTKSYEMEASKLFVNQNIRNKVFLGNLVSHNATPHTNIPEFTEYTFNPTIVYSTIPKLEFIDYTPSLAAHNAYAQTAIDSNPKQAVSWQSDGGSTEFWSYKQLHNIGMINLGVKLDELVSGKPFTKQEMNKKYGLIYSFKQVLFNIGTDFPYRDDVVKEELKAEDKAKGVSYISTVGYGKVGFLIVETDTEPSEIRVIISKIKGSGKESLSSTEITLLEGCDISYVSFDNNTQVQIQKGHQNVIEAYLNGAKDDKNIYPVEFEITNYESIGMQNFKYTYQVPQ